MTDATLPEGPSAPSCNVASYRRVSVRLERVARPQLEYPARPDAVDRYRILRRNRERVDAAPIRGVIPSLLNQVLFLEPRARLSNQPPPGIDEVQHVEHVRRDLQRMTGDRRDRPAQPGIEEVLPGIAAGVPRRQPPAVVPQAGLVVDIGVEQAEYGILLRGGAESRNVAAVPVHRHVRSVPRHVRQ